MLTKNQLGFLYMFMSVCAFSFMDLIVKWSEHYPLGQVLFFRGFFGVLIYFFIMPRDRIKNFYYTKRIDDVGAYTNATDVPYRFIPCMISGLAYYLAVKYAPQRVQELKLLYEDELLRAEDEDGSSNSTYISPKIYYPGIG